MWLSFFLCPQKQHHCFLWGLWCNCEITMETLNRVCVFVFVWYSQPSQRVWDLRHGSRGDRVAGGVRRPGHPCCRDNSASCFSFTIMPTGLKMEAGMPLTCFRREARWGPRWGEGLGAIGQQRVEVGHVGMLHYRHTAGLQMDTETAAKRQRWIWDYNLRVLDYCIRGRTDYFLINSSSCYWCLRATPRPRPWSDSTCDITVILLCEGDSVIGKQLAGLAQSWKNRMIGLKLSDGSSVCRSTRTSLKLQNQKNETQRSEEEMDEMAVFVHQRAHCNYKGRAADRGSK